MSRHWRKASHHRSKKQPKKHSSFDLAYPDMPFVEEFVRRFGTLPGLMRYAAMCYRDRGIGSLPQWDDYCYFPVNVAVGYCEGLGMDDLNAARTAKLMASAQAFLASHVFLEMKANELRDAWNNPCDGPIPFEELANVPTFGYYLDLSPIEAEALGCGMFVSWEDRFGMAQTHEMTLHIARGLRLPEPAHQAAAQLI